MRKKDSAVNAYIDCNKWATKLNTRFSSAEKSEKLNYKEMLGIYAEFSDELTLVRRLVSARVYEELFAITKMPRVYGEWNVKQIGAEIGMDATKMSRLKEPEDGALTSVGPFELRISPPADGKQTRRLPEGFYASVEGLYKTSYFFLDKSCEKVLFGDECAPIHLPHNYSSLFSQISAVPFSDSLRIQVKIKEMCKQYEQYMVRETADGKKPENYVYADSAGAPIDFQELYIKRLNEKMENDCCNASSLFGEDASAPFKNMAIRCFSVPVDTFEKSDRAIFFDKNGTLMRPEKKSGKKEPMGTTGNLMMLSIGLDTAVDYFISPDYTKYSTLLARTNVLDKSGNEREFTLDEGMRSALSSILMISDDNDRSEVVAEALCDCWMAQYSEEIR